MDPAWARGVRDKCRAAGVPFYFKQSNGLYPGASPRLDGEVIDQMPAPRLPLPLTLFD